MKTKRMLAVVMEGCVSVTASAREHDYYRYLRYPKKLLPEIGRDKVHQEGGADAAGYHRRTVTWWPRKGQDIVDVPEGAPLRTGDAKQWPERQGSPRGPLPQLDGL